MTDRAWIASYRQLWDARFDELDKVVRELKRKEKSDSAIKSTAASVVCGACFKGRSTTGHRAPHG
jgi:hypothetical protein